MGIMSEAFLALLDRTYTRDVKIRTPSEALSIEFPLEATLPYRPPLTRSPQCDHDGIFHRLVLR